MVGSLLDVKSLCELHLLYRPLTPAVCRISDGKLLVSNISTVKITRKGDNFFRPDVKPIHKTLQNNSLHWILTLPCESQAIIDDIVYFTGKHCNQQIAEYDINISYPINIMVLKHYFSDHTLLSDLNSALGLNESLFAELLPLLVQDDQYDRILAKEKETRFNFNAALNSSIQQEKIYSDLSDVLFEKIVTIGSSIRSFNPFRPETWCLTLSMAATAINTGMIIWLVMRMKTLQLTLISIRAARADLVFTYPTTTPNLKPQLEAERIWNTIQGALMEISSVETLLALILLVLGAVLILLINKTASKKPKYQAYIRLDLQNANYCLQKTICHLPYSLKHYKVDIYYDGFRVEKFLIFAVIKLAESIKVSQKITELRVSVAETIYLLPNQVENMANLLANSHVANLSIFDYKHRLIELIRLTDGTSIAGRERLNTMSHSNLSDTTASTVKLYPELKE